MAMSVFFVVTEVKEEENAPEEEKMDTSKWENTAHTDWPCFPSKWLMGVGMLIIALLWLL